VYFCSASVNTYTNNIVWGPMHKKSNFCCLVYFLLHYTAWDTKCVWLILQWQKAKHYQVEHGDDDYDCNGHSCQWEAQKRSLNHCFWKSREPRTWLQLLWKHPLSKKKKIKTTVKTESKLDLIWAKAQGYRSQSVLEKTTAYLKGAERTLGGILCICPTLLQYVCTVVNIWSGSKKVHQSCPKN